MRPKIEYGFAVEPKGITSALVKQVHGNNWVEFSLQKARPEADAVWTNKVNVPIHIFTADCLPVLLYSKNPRSPFIAAVHCGWRGALSKIVQVGLQRFRPLLPELYAILGPCIRPCCFQVKEDFIQKFEEKGHTIDKFLQESNGRLYFDLPTFVIETQLNGLLKENIDISENLCTVCSAQKLPSFRRSGGTDPHIRAWIRLLPT